MKILIINPGSTSTKLAVYQDTNPVWMSGAHHSQTDLAAFHHSIEQYQFRMDFIRKRLHDGEMPIAFDAVIG